MLHLINRTKISLCISVLMFLSFIQLIFLRVSLFFQMFSFGFFVLIWYHRAFFFPLWENGFTFYNFFPNKSLQAQYSSQGNFPANGGGYGSGQNRGRGAQGRGGQVQCQVCKKRGHEASTCYHRSAVAPFGNFGSPYSLVSTTFSFNTVLHHPTLVLRNFLATCSNHTLLMAPLPLPGCHTYLIHIFRTQRLLLVINPLSHPIMAPPSSSNKFHLLLTFPRLGFQIQVLHTMQPMIHIISFRAVQLQEMNIS